MSASKACHTKRPRSRAGVDAGTTTRDAPYAAASIATVDASDTSVVWSNRSAGSESRSEAAMFWEEGVGHAAFQSVVCEECALCGCLGFRTMGEG